MLLLGTTTLIQRESRDVDAALRGHMRVGVHNLRGVALNTVKESLVLRLLGLEMAWIVTSAEFVDGDVVRA